MKTIGILGAYRVYRIYDATPKFPSNIIVDDLRKSHSYFQSDKQTYDYFTEKFPEYEINIVPCKKDLPYKEHWDYQIGYIYYLRVTLTKMAKDYDDKEYVEDYGVVILHKA